VDLRHLHFRKAKGRERDDLVSAQMRHALEQLRSIAEISRAINSSLRSRDVLALIVSSAAQLLDAKLAWLGEFEGDSTRYQFAAGDKQGGTTTNGGGLGPEVAGWFEVGHGAIGRAIRAGLAAWVNSWQHGVAPEQVDAGLAASPPSHAEVLATAAAAAGRMADLLEAFLALL